MADHYYCLYNRVMEITWLTTVGDDAGARLVVGPSVMDVAVPEVSGLLTWRGCVCRTLVVDTPAEDTFWQTIKKQQIWLFSNKSWSGTQQSYLIGKGEKMKKTNSCTYSLHWNKGSWYFSLHSFVNCCKGGWGHGTKTCSVALVCVNHNTGCAPAWNWLATQHYTGSCQSNILQCLRTFLHIHYLLPTLTNQ